MLARLVLVCSAAAVLLGCSSSPDPAATDPGRSQAYACPPPAAADASGISPERANLLVGMKDTAAERCAAELGWAFRVGSRDGEQYPVTMDYSTSRVTVSIESGAVVSAVVG